MYFKVDDIIGMRKPIDLWMSMGAYDVFASWPIFECKLVAQTRHNWSGHGIERMKALLWEQ
jgi:hypothetical protein